MRLFIAIPLPSHIKEYLRIIQESCKKASVPAKWVNPDNMHMTLKFLGETPDKEIPLIKDIIGEAAAPLKRMELRFVSFGFFPGERNPRVFFVATDKEEVLKALAFRLEEKLQPLGYEPEHRFKSHITLARFKDRKDVSELLKITGTLTPDKTFLFDSIILYKSTLHPAGPVYEAVAGVKLPK